MNRVTQHLRQFRRAAYRPIAKARRLSAWQVLAIILAAVIIFASIDYALHYRSTPPGSLPTEQRSPRRDQSPA